MAPPSATASPKIVADLSGVQEISLQGSADYEYWRRRLVDERVRPWRIDGGARLLVTAMEGRFHGIQFRELSFCVLLEADAPSNAAFLVQAFNSSRLFACCERFFFHTPYRPAMLDVRLTPTPRVAARTEFGERLEFQVALSAAQNGPAERQPDRVNFENWEGRVWLPLRRAGGARRWFQATLQGETETYAATAADAWRIEAPRVGGILHDLVESDFQPRQWQLRRAARHAKSKTCREVDS